MRYFIIPDDIEELGTEDKTVPIPLEPILRQHLTGVIAELGNPDNYSPDLDEEYRLKISSFYAKLLYQWVSTF